MFEDDHGLLHGHGEGDADFVMRGEDAEEVADGEAVRGEAFDDVMHHAGNDEEKRLAVGERLVEMACTA